MLNRRIRVALVKRTDLGELEIKIIEDFEDELHNIYKTIECSTIDIIKRSIKGRPLEFIVDDEYLLTDKPKNAPTGIYAKSPLLEQIYGAFLITGPGDQEGNLTDLSNKDIEAIMGARRVASRAPRDNPQNIEYFDTIAYAL